MRYRSVFTADEAARVRAAVVREMSDRGIGQRKAAVLFGIAQQSVSYVLSGRSEPRRSTVEKIATALGVTVDALISPPAPDVAEVVAARALESTIGEAFAPRFHTISDAVAALRFLADAGIRSATPAGAKVVLDAAARTRKSAGTLTPLRLEVEVARAAVGG